MSSVRTLAAFSLSSWVLTSSAAAAGKDAAVVVLGEPQASPVAEQAARVVSRALERNARRSIVSGAALVQRIGGPLRDSPALDPAAVTALEREASELLEIVAFGRDDDTLTRGAGVVRREAARLTATNQSDAASTALGDVCLFMVRALMHRGSISEARNQARECVRLVPDLHAKTEIHPREVRELVEVARRRDVGRLQVSQLGFAPGACSLRVQGRALQKLPASLDLIPGGYAVEADCGIPASIHHVTVEPASTARVVVAPLLERALRFGDPLLLRTLEGQAAEPARLKELAEWATLAEVWTLEPVSAGLRLTRWERTNRALVVRGSSTQPLDPAETLAARLASRAEKLACEPFACSERDTPPKRSGHWAFKAAAGVGAAAMLGSWAAWARYQSLDNELANTSDSTSTYANTFDERNSWRTVALISSLSGSAVFTGSAPFWLPEEQSVPWWAWSAGAAGVAAAGVGTVLWLRNGQLDPPDCLTGCRQQSTLPLAPLLVSQGVSLLALPATYFIRSWTRADALAIGVGASLGQISIGCTGRVPTL